MAGALGVVFAYSRYKASKAAAANATSTTGAAAAGEPAGTAPDFIIENNIPSYNGHSAPVPTPVAAPPAVTPPGTSPTPPVNTPPISGLPLPVTPAPGPIKPVTTPPAPLPAPAKKAPISYKVISGDTLSSIAAKYHTTAAALYTYNTTPGVRPAATIATLKQRGPNLIYSGETILIPQ
jgi:hypothetical protein